MTDTSTADQAAPPDAPALPSIGAPVRFRLRGGEFRNGANVFAALCVRHNEDNTINVVVVLDADDFMSQRNVPRAVDGEFGWEPLEFSEVGEYEALKRSLEDFKDELAEVIFGDFKRVQEPIYGTLAEFELRIKALEDAAVPAPSAARASRKSRKAGKARG